jgi:DNA-binding beta-propeller fold protein YncE
MMHTELIRRILTLLACLSAVVLLACCGGSNGSSANPGNPPPNIQLTSLNPSSIQAGSPAFALRISGANFDSSCQVQWAWDGEVLGTFSNVFVSSTQLQVQLNASDAATIGPVAVIVGCRNGSGFLDFQVTGFPRTEIDQAANYLVWDPIRQVIYLSVPPTVPGGSGIAVLDPVGQKIISFTPVANNPDVLAISDDSQYLYVGLDDSSSVERFILPQLTEDIEYSINQPGDFPYDIQVARGASHTTAVSIGIPDITTPSAGGVTIFDDGQPRPASIPGIFDGGTGNCFCGGLQWSSTNSALYSSNDITTGFDFYSLAVDSAGVVLTQDYPNVFNSFDGNYFGNIHYLPSTGLIYSDDLTIVNPLTGSVVGNFPLPEGAIDINRLVPDSTLNLGALLSQIDCVADGSSGTCFLLSTFHLADFSFLNSLEISNVKNVYGAINMIRWGPTGLAFNTDTGQVYLVDISTLLQPASTRAAASLKTSQSHDLVRNHGRIVTTTKRHWHPTGSNKAD